MMNKPDCCAVPSDPEAVLWMARAFRTLGDTYINDPDRIEDPHSMRNMETTVRNLFQLVKEERAQND